MIAEMLLAGAVMLNTSYTGPDITSVESREVGMRECVKAHTSGYQKIHGGPLPTNVLMELILVADRDDYCFGSGGSGDALGNHAFVCFAITWPESPPLDFALRCTQQFEKSYLSYAEWLDQRKKFKVE